MQSRVQPVVKYVDHFNNVWHNPVRRWKDECVKYTTSGLTAHACCPYSGITLVRVSVRRGGGRGVLKAGWISLITGFNGADTSMRVKGGFRAIGALYRSMRRITRRCNSTGQPEDGSHTQRYASRYKSTRLKTRMRVLFNGLHRNNIAATEQLWRRLPTTLTYIFVLEVTHYLTTLISEILNRELMM